VALGKRNRTLAKVSAALTVVTLVLPFVFVDVNSSVFGWAFLAGWTPLAVAAFLAVGVMRQTTGMERLYVSPTATVFRVRSLAYAQALAASNVATVQQVRFYTGPKEQRSDVLERRHEGKRALNKDVLSANEGESNTRMNVALGAVLGTSVIGALVMRDHGMALLEPLVFLASAGGALGGALFHPIRRYWRKGLACGVLVNLGGMAATYFYMLPRTTVWNYELVIPLAVGGAPGALLYWLLMRREVVGSSQKDGARAGGGGTPTAVP
jgi:hypothetical protein